MPVFKPMSTVEELSMYSRDMFDGVFEMTKDEIFSKGGPLETTNPFDTSKLAQEFNTINSMHTFGNPNREYDTINTLATVEFDVQLKKILQNRGGNTRAIQIEDQLELD